MDDKDRVAAFKALGDPTRAKIFDFLRSCCCEVAVDDAGDIRPVDGPSVGDVCCHVTGVEKITSTISFHLKELRNAGLVSMEKRGKHMVCSVNREAVGQLAAYLAGGSDGNPDCCSR